MKLHRIIACIVLMISLIIPVTAIYIRAEDATQVDVDVDSNLGDLEGEDSLTTMAVAPPEINVPTAMLMEASTGKILFEKNGEEALPPASVTKIMTILLVMEALENEYVHLNDLITISAYASSMGGSQVFLSEGEQMTLEDLLKCTIIASANDAAVALAEYIAGSESSFVAKMNDRAQELGATTAHFENVTGLDDDTTNHVMSAKDIALISKELIKHKKVLEYSSVWMDSIRNGEFTLTNTNRLIRYYNGATGLKTGSTDKAKFCITATAERDGMSLIAVIMGAESRDARNDTAKTLLDWGYANYTLYTEKEANCADIPVLRGEKDILSTFSKEFSMVVTKGDYSKIEKQISQQETILAPIEKESVVGTISYYIDGEMIGTNPVLAKESIKELSFWQLFGNLMKIYFLS